MSCKSNRRFLRLTKYQKQFIKLGFVPVALVFLAMSAFVTYMLNQMVHLMEKTANPVTVVTQTWAGFLIFSSITMFVLVWAVMISGRFMGAFPRILKELDGILADEEKRHIEARPGDVLAPDVLERVNPLIDRMDQAPGSDRE